MPTIIGASPGHPRPTRRGALAAGVAGLACAALSAPSHGASPAGRGPAEIRIAVIGDGLTGIWASMRAGPRAAQIARDLGSRPVWQPGFTASLPVMEAVRAGGIDFTFATATAVVNAVIAGVDIAPLAAFPLPVNEVDVVVLADSPIRGAADLRGRKVAHQNGTTGTYSLIKYLDTAGLRLGDIEAISLSGADAYTALAQGSVDAWIHWQPATGLALAKLGPRGRTLSAVGTYDYAFYVASKAFADRHAETAARLVRLIRDTQRAIAADPDGAVALWAAQGGFAPGSVEEGVYRKLIVDARLSESTAIALAPVGEAAARATQEMADTFRTLGVLPDTADLSGFLLSRAFDPIRAAVAGELAA